MEYRPTNEQQEKQAKDRLTSYLEQLAAVAEQGVSGKPEGRPAKED